jgi:hypothetical protein
MRTQKLVNSLGFLAGLMFAAGAGHAAEVWHTSTVRAIYPLADGSFVLTFNANSASCASADNPHYYYARAGQNGMTAEGSKKMYAIAALAFATNKPVSFAFDNATASCFINRLSVGSL